MKIYYVNRDDRDDRNYLFRGAMAAAGYTPDELVRVPAMKKEDYPTREALCDAAAQDGFQEFFSYQKEQPWPGYGHLVCSWSVMRAWRMIAENGEVAAQFLDDYYLRKRRSDLETLIEILEDLKILQLAWHTRDDVFYLDEYNLNLPYVIDNDTATPAERSGDVHVGAGQGCSDWALIMSPEGASTLLDYMKFHPHLNTECALTGLYYTFRHINGIYSVKGNDPKENGTHVLKHNTWLGHLVEYTNGNMSDLSGTHEEHDTDD